MKNATKTSLLITIVAISCALSANSMAQAMNAKNIQSVAIKAQRLSAEQKRDYDQQQANHSIQRVIISAKRLNPDAKLQYDRSVSQ